MAVLDNRIYEEPSLKTPGPASLRSGSGSGSQQGAQRGRTLSAPETKASSRVSSVSTSSRSSVPLQQMVPGMSGDFAPQTASPTSPLANMVHSNALLNPCVVHVHKMSLRRFGELEGAQQRSSSGTPNPPSIGQPSSIGSSRGGYGYGSSVPASRPESRASSKDVECADFANSVTDALRPLSNAQASRPPTSKRVTRPLSREEVGQRSREAVDWFRAARAINICGRSIEETEALLAAAKERRISGSTRRSRSNSKAAATKPADDDMDEATATAQPAAEAPSAADAAPPSKTEGRRTCIDPAALWGARPPVPATAAKPPAIKIRRSMAEGVAVGDGGCSLRERMLSSRNSSKE